MLPDRWGATNAAYYFESDPGELRAIIVLSVDEPSYSDPGSSRLDEGRFYPIGVQHGIRREAPVTGNTGYPVGARTFERNSGGQPLPIFELGGPSDLRTMRVNAIFRC